MRTRKCDLATTKEIIAFFTMVMRDENFDTTIRMKAAESLSKHMQQTTEEPYKQMTIKIDYGEEVE